MRTDPQRTAKQGRLRAGTGALSTGMGGAGTNDGGRPGPWRRRLRPFGYLTIGLVWTVLWLVSVALPVGCAIYFVTDPEIVSGTHRNFSTVGGILLELLIVVPAMALAMGPGAMWHVGTASWPLAVLSFVYVARSFRPSYAGEKLSFTTWAARGSTFGPPTLNDVAMSLQPVRSTPFTDAVMRFYVAGWSIDGRMVVAWLPAGVAWSTLVQAFTPGWAAWVRVVLLVATVVLAGTTAALAVRAFRLRFAPRGVPGEQQRVVELTSEQRRRRMRELERRRAARRR